MSESVRSEHDVGGAGVACVGHVEFNEVSGAEGQDDSMGRCELWSYR